MSPRDDEAHGTTARDDKDHETHPRNDKDHETHPRDDKDHGTTARDEKAHGTTARDDKDHGASAERTRLAWRRTVLSATACGLLAARPAFDPAAGGAKWLAAALAMAGWSALIALAYRRARALSRQPPHPARRAVTAYALVTIGFAALGGLVVML